MVTKAWKRAALGSVAAVLVVAACGGDDSSDDTPATDSPAAETSTPDEEPAGEPLRIMNLSATTGDLPYPQVVEGARAAAEAINAAGGVNGRPIELLHCDVASVVDSNPATQCARDLVADESILAEVGDLHSFGGVINPILNAGGVTAVGPTPFSASQLSDPNSFPLSSSEGAALGQILIDNGVEDIKVAHIDIPAGAECVGLVDAFLGMGRGGRSSSSPVAVPLTATDFSPQVAAAAEADGAVLCLANPQTVQFLRTVAEGGYELAMSIPGLNVDDQQLELIRPYADGVFVALGLPPVTSTSLPGIQRFHEEMDLYAPDAARDEASLNAWMGVHAFAIVVAGIDGDITRSAVLDAFNAHGTLDVFGLLPPEYDTTKPSEIPGLERLFNMYYRSGVIQDGELIEPEDRWFSNLVDPNG